MTYRKAKCIELHDAYTVITTSPEGYALSAPTARGEQASRPAFLVRQADVSAFARHFGLNISPRPANPTQAVGMDGNGLPLFRAYREVPAQAAGVTILSLECDVQGPNLVEIRMESRLDGTPPEAANDVEVITHSGSFPIWWEAEKPQDAQQLLAQAEAHPTIPVEGELDGEVIAQGEPLELDLEEADGTDLPAPNNET